MEATEFSTPLLELGTGSETAAAIQTAVQVPQWLIDLHRMRQDLFLRIVEPVIVFILGPGRGDEDEHEVMHHSPFASDHRDVDSSHRRLLAGFLPDYVEDVSSFRETSMSFATLTMLFIIMTCLATVFLSCFYHNQKTSPLFISPRRHRLPKLVPPPLPVDSMLSWVSACGYLRVYTAQQIWMSSS